MASQFVSKVQALPTFCFFYLAVVAYLGGILKNFGRVFSDEKFALKIVDYLIQERSSIDAIFLKGLMFKYGLKHDETPNLSTAQTLLKEAADKGSGGAIIELRELDIHFKTSNYS